MLVVRSVERGERTNVAQGTFANCDLRGRLLELCPATEAEGNHVLPLHSLRLVCHPLVSARNRDGIIWRKLESTVKPMHKTP